MTYLDIISLDDAKNYLRIDDTLTEDDASITRMIKSALLYVEKATNHIMFARDKNYTFVDGCCSVYDYPINVTTLAPDVRIDVKTLYTNYAHHSALFFALNIGYLNSSDIPEGLIDVAYEIIDLYYYGSKDGGTVGKKLSMLSKEVLAQHRRFIL